LEIINKKRIIEIDFLRGVAILLVLFHHSKIANIFSNFGWVGVDLFFVLSGFLVSGILYSEIISTNKLNFIRFLVRRSFKIYPSFYLFLIVTVFIKLYFIRKGYNNQQFELTQLFSEIFFTQNYITPIWNHTWSLAVEEHFYIILIILFVIAFKTRLIFDRLKMRSFFFILLLLCNILRIFIVYSEDLTLNRNYYPTHIRIDSLFFGVLLADLYYFDNKKFVLFISKWKYYLTSLSIILLLPLFFFSRYSVLINTIGYSLFYLSFGIVLSLFITYHIQSILQGWIKNYLFHSISYIGFFSYSIYLWHMIVVDYILPFIQHNFYVNTTPLWIFLISQILLSLLLGIFFAKIVEMPLLKIREKLFPASF
jgi:peptidoglycan/LPS O-acetylase OafA/YrhL